MSSKIVLFGWAKYGEESASMFCLYLIVGPNFRGKRGFVMKGRQTGTPLHFQVFLDFPCFPSTRVRVVGATVIQVCLC